MYGWPELFQLLEKKNELRVDRKKFLFRGSSVEIAVCDRS
jgi:hypothetical protein